MSIKKCGPFMEKEGVIVKRPGKKFRCPPMPQKMKIPCEHLTGASRDDVEQMNALMEQRWCKAKRDEYKLIRRLYYIQECSKFILRTCEQILVFMDRSNKRMVDPNAYSALHSSRYHS